MKKLAIVGLALFVLLVSAVGVAAAASIPGDCLDTVDIAGFTVCFIGKDDNTDGTTTWTYAVQSDAEESTAALSHFTVELCPTTYKHVEPGHDETYTTPASLGGFSGRDGIEYVVQIGEDPTTRVGGIKFEDGEPGLGEDGAVEVDIFQFDLPTQNFDIGEITIGIKAPGSYTNTIDGPVFVEGANSDADGVVVESCTVPTAVRLVNFRASRLSIFDWLLSLLGFLR